MRSLSTKVMLTLAAAVGFATAFTVGAQETAQPSDASATAAAAEGAVNGESRRERRRREEAAAAAAAEAPATGSATATSATAAPAASATAAPAVSATAANATTAEAGVTCRTFKETGTRLRRQKVCATAEEWARMERNTAEGAAEFRRRGNETSNMGDGTGALGAFGGGSFGGE